MQIKPLEWEPNLDQSEGGLIAVGIFGVRYHAMEDGWSLHRQMRWKDATSLESAKAAAQADYEATILSSIVVSD